jgi:high-affinity Fe2+/Pb2+ permease
MKCQSTSVRLHSTVTHKNLIFTEMLFNSSHFYGLNFGQVYSCSLLVANVFIYTDTNKFVEYNMYFIYLHAIVTLIFIYFICRRLQLHSYL